MLQPSLAARSAQLSRWGPCKCGTDSLCFGISRATCNPSNSLLLQSFATHHIHTQQRFRTLARGIESLHRRPLVYTYYYNAHLANAPATLGQTIAPKHTDLASRRGPSQTIPTPAQSSPVQSRTSPIPMAVERILPEDRNPMLAEERAPSRTSILQSARLLTRPLS